MFIDVAVHLCDPGTSTAARHLMFKYALIVCFLSNWGKKNIHLNSADMHHPFRRMHLVGEKESISWKWC
jgi:hypothetical protein